MIPVLFHLGPISLYSFGLFMMLAFLSAWRLLYQQLRQQGEDQSLAEKLVFAAAIGGIIGARIFYILSFPDDFLADPLRAIFSGAGFVFYGGFIGGLTAVLWVLKKAGKNVLFFADMIAPALSIGYAVGRIGCQLSGDGDYGKVSHLAWAIGYPLGTIPTAAGITVHPTPVYETIFSLLITFILCSKNIKAHCQTHTGSLFGLYLLLSSVARFFVEIVRIEPIVFAGLTQAQLESFFFCMIGIFLYSRKRIWAH